MYTRSLENREVIDEPFPASFCTKELRNTRGKSTLKPPRRLELVPGSQWALVLKRDHVRKKRSVLKSVPLYQKLSSWHSFQTFLRSSLWTWRSPMWHWRRKHTVLSSFVESSSRLRLTYSKYNSATAPDLPFSLGRSRGSCSVLRLARWFRTHDVGFQLSQTPTYQLRKAPAFPPLKLSEAGDRASLDGPAHPEEQLIYPLKTFSW